jgi:predicted RNA binding protein YcfA (HicA-like mRNA interferase family)
MPKYKPLKYRDIITILHNLGFTPTKTGATSHQTWLFEKDGKYYAVTTFFHGSNMEFRPGTLNSIIRQSGFTKEEFYNALKKK